MVIQVHKVTEEKKELQDIREIKALLEFQAREVLMDLKEKKEQWDQQDHMV